MHKTVHCETFVVKWKKTFIAESFLSLSIVRKLTAQIPIFLSPLTQVSAPCHYLQVFCLFSFLDMWLQHCVYPLDIYTLFSYTPYNLGLWLKEEYTRAYHCHTHTHAHPFIRQCCDRLCIQIQLMVSLLLLFIVSKKPAGPVEQQQTSCVCVPLYVLLSDTSILCSCVIARLYTHRVCDDLTSAYQKYQSFLERQWALFVCVFLLLCYW